MSELTCVLAAVVTVAGWVYVFGREGGFAGLLQLRDEPVGVADVRGALLLRRRGKKRLGSCQEGREEREQVDGTSLSAVAWRAYPHALWVERAHVLVHRSLA